MYVHFGSYLNTDSDMDWSDSEYRKSNQKFSSFRSKNHIIPGSKAGNYNCKHESSKGELHDFQYFKD